MGGIFYTTLGALRFRKNMPLLTIGRIQAQLGVIGIPRIMATVGNAFMARVYVRHGHIYRRRAARARLKADGNPAVLGHGGHRLGATSKRDFPWRGADGGPPDNAAPFNNGRGAVPHLEPPNIGGNRSGYQKRWPENRPPDRKPWENYSRKTTSTTRRGSRKRETR